MKQLELFIILIPCIICFLIAGYLASINNYLFASIFLVVAVMCTNIKWTS